MIKLPAILTVFAVALFPAVPTLAVPPPTELSARVDNEWFPLTPGARYVSVGVKDGRRARDVMTVTHRTATIAGAPCRVVDDRLYLAGRLAERTTDWYSQDRRGNVWYFGEQTAGLDAHGRVTTTSGTWRAGVDGARPGIFMPAHPRRGQGYRQELAKGVAEDRFEVVAVLHETVVSTKEWTPLEPGTVDHKLYIRGVGTVLELTVKGGDERLELVSVTGLR
jgi:hypothetical protein